MDYFYDRQIERYVAQLIRVFSNFYCDMGLDDQGKPKLVRIPCRYASTDRMVSHIIRSGSENKIVPTPFITGHITAVSIDRSRTGPNTLTDHLHFTERAIDPNTGNYTNQPGLDYTVERLNPTPMLMEWTTEIWTSNTNQKLQICEQLWTIFNPAIDIQNSTNPLDWTALTTVELVDHGWSSNTIPMGNNENIDIMNFRFRVPIYITPPAKVTRQKLIHQIVTDINATTESDIAAVKSDLDNLGSFAGFSGDNARVITTPNEFRVQVINGNTLKLLGPDGVEYGQDGNTFSWAQLFDLFGELKNDISQIRIKLSSDIEVTTTDVVGRIYYTSQENLLQWVVDQSTLPANTAQPINAYINPHTANPGNGLPAAAVGQRYLLSDELGNSAAWGNLQAVAGSIIQYSAAGWYVDFVPTTDKYDTVTTNLTSGHQLRYTADGWIDALDGVYNPGYWRIYLNG